MENMIHIPVRTSLMPLFYRDFHCLMADCRNSCCCAGWEIEFNKKDYLKIKRSIKNPEMLGLLSRGMSRIRKNGPEKYYAHFDTGTSGVCAFLSEDSLCRLQLECGAEALPEVCREYPRKNVYTSAAREFSLSPSCEGVLALLWELPQGIDFLEQDLPKQEWKTVQLEPRLAHRARFQDIRSFCIDVLQERSLSISQRMQMLGVLLWRLKELDWSKEGVIDSWLEWGAQRLHDPSAAALKELHRDKLGFFTGNLYILADLYTSSAAKEKEIYRSMFSALSAVEDWDQGGLGKFSLDSDRYQELEGQLKRLLRQSDYFFENLMVLTAFYEAFPAFFTPEDLWRSYADLCSLYSFFWFAAVCGCDQETSRERLFQVIVTVSRGLQHSEERRKKLLDGLFARGGGTLDGLAVLAGG